MGWIIQTGRLGKTGNNAGFGPTMNAVVITSQSITTNSRHTLAHFGFTPNADKTTVEGAGSNPARQEIWRNVLSTLVGT
jgi:hypothetical protein